MAKKLGVGVIGCGNISTAYLGLAPLFRGIEMRACADINMQAAKARAKEYKIRAETVDNLLKADDIDIVVNLTVPAVHYDVSKQVLDAGSAQKRRACGSVRHRIHFLEARISSRAISSIAASSAGSPVAPAM